MIATFGARAKDSAVPLGRLSVLYDVLNEVVVDVELVACAVGEPVLAGEHLAATDAGELLLNDRLPMLAVGRGARTSRAAVSEELPTSAGREGYRAGPRWPIGASL